MSWGISNTAPKKEKIKAEMADYLHGLNATGVIDYDLHKETSKIAMRLLDEMYALGEGTLEIYYAVYDYNTSAYLPALISLDKEELLIEASSYAYAHLIQKEMVKGQYDAYHPSALMEVYGCEIREIKKEKYQELARESS